MNIFSIGTYVTDSGRRVKLIRDGYGLAMQADVQSILEVCQSHLEECTDKDAHKLNAKISRKEREKLKRLSRKPKLARSGFVYLMRDNANGRIKIGWSSHPSWREKTLQAEKPDIELIAKWPGSLRDEEALHERFAKQRIRGEWFTLSDKQVKELQAYGS